MIALRTYTPTALSPIVKSIWQLQVYDVGDSVYREDILPDGHHEIIFNVTGKNAKRTTEQANWIKEPDAFFAGQTMRSYSLELENNSLLYGIRFHPHTLQVLFGFPADLTTNNLIQLYDIPLARVLRDCITEEFEATCGNLEKALLQLCKGVELRTNKFQYIDYAVQEIIKHKGDVSISGLLKGIGVSQRHFDTLFTQSVGINPKPFCNIVKLN
ncbi:MAG: DUF6597 domain-containing transcriptional factor, partial [Niastella sp.]|uniref:DUF6597 domain-containing transcriptional factor n=1 Tax=Niastella sp. TaxID=1869183 RepID=UPI00389A7292